METRQKMRAYPQEILEPPEEAAESWSLQTGQEGQGSRAADHAGHEP